MFYNTSDHFNHYQTIKLLYNLARYFPIFEHWPLHSQQFLISQQVIWGSIYRPGNKHTERKACEQPGGSDGTPQGFCFPPTPVPASEVGHFPGEAEWEWLWRRYHCYWSCCARRWNNNWTNKGKKKMGFLLLELWRIKRLIAIVRVTIEISECFGKF